MSVRSALTGDEMLGLLHQVRLQPRELCMFCLGFKHGMRASEICGLELQDLDLKNELITINRLKGSMRSVQQLVDVPGQPLLQEIRIVKNWLKVRPQDATSYLFVSQKGGRLGRVQLYRLFRDAARAAGLPRDKQHPHCMKHSLAEYLRTHNVDITVIKQALGHRSITSTMPYLHPTDQEACLRMRKAFAEG